ncbi:GNAT family N-acetyltransferase [Hymenobacter sp. AT01-02]|uniref:GNAT family N-acetyltransferase n=1 Tax=Hymenobacter sp. AT01-02 TaxID=1571877 RepID=UPI0009E75591|nr:GNAT family N-acetyltransferase [Hymenobacter sp. AT01-02]
MGCYFGLDEEDRVRVAGSMRCTPRENLRYNAAAPTFGIMLPRLLRYSEIDLAAWDACVHSAQQVVPYACSWWLQATAGRWDALVEVDEQTGRYLSLWPLPVKWRPWGQQVYQPPFTQQLGILGAAWPLLRGVATIAGHYTSFYTQLNDANGIFSLQDSAPTRQPSLTWQTRQTYHLPLDQPYATVRAAYAADYRRRLRLNEAAIVPLLVTATDDAEPVLTLFQQTKGKAAGLRSRHYRIMRRLVTSLRKQQVLQVLEVRQPETDELLAGALFVHYRTRLVYLFAAASEAGKKVGAPVLLLDSQIRRYAGTPELILDFEGGMIPSIARFFANFGAVPVPYAALSFTQRPWYLKWMR